MVADGSEGVKGKPAVPNMLPETRVLSPGELKEGVQRLRDTFPDIIQTVAELTLQVSLSQGPCKAT